MKISHLITRLFGMTLFFVLFAGMTFASGPALPVDADLGGWERLGSKNVKYGLDRDEIIVTRMEGKFSKIKLRVNRGGLNMHKCTIHFGNGDVQRVALKKNFKAGSESRVIDIQGGRRVIKKVVFWYDTKNLARKKAQIVLWGRH